MIAPLRLQDPVAGVIVAIGYIGLFIVATFAIAGWLR